MPDIPVSENHRRGISSTLGILDEMLCRFERWAKGESVRGVLYREEGKLSPEQRAAILKEIRNIRETLTQLRNKLELNEKTIDIPTAIWSQCSWFWEALVELESRHLRRYGSLPAGLEKYLDPKIHHIIEHLTKISEIVHARPPGGSA
jgi:hypothetical protein